MMQGLVGTDPAIRYTVSPTGGIIVVQPKSAADFGSWTLTRFVSVSGQAVSGVVLSQGVSGQPPLQVFVDIGDGANTPLDSNQLYVYGLTTANGTVETPALSAACTIIIEQDHINSILFRALQSGIAALALPAGFNNRPTITHAMPLAGAGVPTLPSIAFNETLLQPQNFRIGEDVDTDSLVNEFQISTQALRHFTIFVMTSNVREREYYKDAVIAIFSGLLPILDKIGNNISHRFQVSSSQLTGRQNEPGFYFSEILLEFTGLYTVGVTTSYGVIEHFDFVFNTQEA